MGRGSDQVHPDFPTGRWGSGMSGVEDEPGLQRFALTSMTPQDPRYAVLRDLVPEAFSEEEVDGGRLLAALGLDGESGQERYGLSWPGRREATVALQEPSIGTLLPEDGSALNPDEARDVIVEGDNLEVLKLLQRAYYGKVKLIYIDPPYNTGKEFIYPDNYREGLSNYLRFTGQSDEEGRRLSANVETAGRYHSKWLSMMYPRLALARNLLRPDGAIFLTIDDHEVHNLRLLMDEVFGPENFVATCIWQKVYSPKNTARHFSDDHDYVMVYARNAAEWEPNPLPRTEAMEARYKNPDKDPRGPWKSGDLSARNYYSKGTYSVVTPSGRIIDGPPAGRYWVYSKEKLEELVRDDRVWFGEDGDGVPAIKQFLSEVKEGRVPQTLWTHEEVGHNQEAKKELLQRVTFASSDSVFDTPKPTRLIERMLRLATNADSNDLVLDFFAGSGATGEAVWKLNLEDGGNRRFILVQLPEPTGHDDYETVADITRARLNGAAAGLASSASAESGGNPRLGFQIYKLAASNFEVWDGSAVAGDESVADVLRLFAENVRQPGAIDAIAAELVLKAGFELTTPIETLALAGEAVHAVDGGKLLMYLGDTLSIRLIEELVARRPSLILTLDSSFGNDDELKVNALQTVRTANHDGGADITLKVV